MNIVSYRGPGMAGGVSSALNRIWEEHSELANWWHLGSNNLQVACGTDGGTRKLTNLSKELIDGHYNYCNEFLWPVMHDLPQYATMKREDRERYYRFNEILAKHISGSALLNTRPYFFVQDYQLALLPEFFRRNGLSSSSVFWHIPWPKEVRADHITALAQIARGLLASEAVGFHVQEYGENFLRFVDEHIPDYMVDFESMTAMPVAQVNARALVLSSYNVEPRARNAWKTRTTQVVIAPLGLDHGHWSKMAASARFLMPQLTRKPYVLSVDRADYTKGVTNRLKAIDVFMTKYPQYRGQVVFAQICGRTRTGLNAFDSYWQECKELEQMLKNNWATPDWSPLYWVQSGFTCDQLSLLYRNAAAMLVNPIRDGLNLTAKEYIACQGTKNPGVLALSKGAGAWHELGNDAVEVIPESPEQIADAVAMSLAMEKDERQARMRGLTESLHANPLELWWDQFATDSGAANILTGKKSATRVG